MNETASTPRILTIGVYGAREDQFFETLVDAGVDMFCDVRARRGLRGSEYAFANSVRLQARLSEIGIPYRHLKHLAPSAATRAAQRAADVHLAVTKRSRDVLGDVFIERYRQECLTSLDLQLLLQETLGGAQRPALFCVEGSPLACHRSLLADWISKQSGLAVEHLRPCER